ncbi:acetyl-CoA synthetase [Symbiobacterium terraclitae]|uniref:Acetyl-coenzyme A synthetase n=1 Tax=Symbiobacterium terraclitae TaxID=557451 RepID=A0ABS4JTC6_9FIRM|nr:acetate--CoA ligase [Symbiobacterium terraclitae]MBP2018785.1 acetyl-CoA synthetase [Symbiobacterium terraclitae]
MDTKQFEALLQEDRRFAPPPAFAAAANVSDNSLYEQAARDREGFWAAQAERLHWFKRWDRVLEWNPPFAQWFVGGKLNVAYNCLDRHLETPTRTKAAIIWEGEPGEERVLTYLDLHREVCRFANVLRQMGVGKGDRVTIYLPMIPEAAVAMLACTRIGAIHSVVFGGFSAESLRDRINDSRSKVVITADGGWRRGNIIRMKQIVNEAIVDCPSVEKVVVVKRIGHESLVEHGWHPGRDAWYHTLMRNAPLTCPVEEMDAEDPLFILYTSGSTGKPKGVLHTTGGYLTQVAATTKYVFDLKDSDVYWCTADIGWITGHSYVVYGPLANGATTLMYEGAPDYPDRGRFWEIVEKYRVNIFYTAPTAIRSFMRWGEGWPAKYDLSSLRLLGTVGEPINPEAWMWYHKNIGRERCPIVDTWWQTETGAIMCTPLPGVTETKPGSATRPFPGIEMAIVNEKGEKVPQGSGGYLVVTSPWPAMLRTVWGDPARYTATYFAKFGESTYFTGDGAKWDDEGYFWIIGRVDDVINVSGHRIGTMEVESALVDHPMVAEAAVIGRTHAVKGQAIAAFVTLKEGRRGTPDLADELKQHVATKIGALARPEEIYFTADLPKTRSGKIMRRLLRDIAEGRALGDTTTLADPAVVAQLREQYEAKEAG